MNEPFYVGYQKRAPAELSGFLKRWVLGLGLGALGLAGLLSQSQRDFDPGVFEYLEVREFTGDLRVEPIPVLQVPRPGLLPRPGQGKPSVSSYLLVGFGKHGLDQEILALAGNRVTLRGTLIHREGETMIEVMSGSAVELEASTGSFSGNESVDYGSVTLIGEIVGSKCYLGVMKPGRFKSHRACATRCISGGVPAIFVVEDASGDREIFVLLDADGEVPGREILDFVAEPIRVTGQLSRRGDRFLLATDSKTFERLDGAS